jgi:hypothetical protein
MRNSLNQQLEIEKKIILNNSNASIEVFELRGCLRSRRLK